MVVGGDGKFESISLHVTTITYILNLSSLLTHHLLLLKDLFIQFVSILLQRELLVIVDGHSDDLRCIRFIMLIMESISHKYSYSTETCMDERELQWQLNASSG